MRDVLNADAVDGAYYVDVLARRRKRVISARKDVVATWVLGHTSRRVSTKAQRGNAAAAILQPSPELRSTPFGFRRLHSKDVVSIT